MSPRGLTGLAIDTLLSSWYDMRSIFALLADKSHWPVLVHCTQGKDRTGLTVLLLELLCGVDEEVCERDYMATQGRLDSEREGRVREIEEIGLPAEWADCEPGWVGRVKGFIDGRWGGVGGYLFWCGVKREEVVAVKEILMASPA
ncbi:tyrosine phosphatase family-like protein [Elsinoe australis]|uniref:Tyrosine phosphatase family-like protein n=1 Tax=Elsinoe australis TaxID=40998 RepID=A0A4U7AP57_9PEZI|nr:tyrosine phosphatase family-like protein [Elsinoe australis]